MRLTPIALCVLALATTAHGFDEPAAPAWQVQQLQESVAWTNAEVAELRQEVLDLRALVKLMLDADPALKEKIRQQIKEQESHPRWT